MINRTINARAVTVVSMVFAFAVMGYFGASNAYATPKHDEPQVAVCHYNNGHGGSWEAITIDESGWEHGHSNHANDFLVDGTHPCPPVAGDDDDDNEGDDDDDVEVPSDDDDDSEEGDDDDDSEVIDVCLEDEGIQTELEDCINDEGVTDVCPDMDGIQEFAYECEVTEGDDDDDSTEEDVCPNDEGIQTSEEECSIEQTDEQTGDDDDDSEAGDDDDDSEEEASTESASRSNGGRGGILKSSDDTDEDNDGDSEVLGASCTPYLTSYIKFGAENPTDQVIKLQNFLNEELNLTLPVTGIYDAATMEAVKTFQVKYWEEVLLPWVSYGLPTDHTPTGYVYKTTQRWINMIKCKDLNLPKPQLP